MKSSFHFIFILFAFTFCSFMPANELKEKYHPGYYISESEKVDGYIYFTYNTYEKFNFKKDLLDKKSLKRAGECNGFSVDGKTFEVIKNIDLKIGVWNISAEQAFAEVIIKGPINLFKIYASIRNGSMTNPGSTDVVNFIVEKNNSKTYVLAHSNKKKFKAEMVNLFQDRKDIVERIESGGYELDNIIELVKDYNTNIGSN